jgi:hypothetical protein
MPVSTTPEDLRSMMTREYTHEGHVARFTVTRGQAAGWEVREERDDNVIRRQQFTDWHRVERALRDFERKAGRGPDHSTNR